MDGIISLLKPPGMTSHDAVAIVRKRLRPGKIGHTGTLDPDAAGVLPVCLGQATRISEYLLEGVKAYRAEMQVGVATDSLDAGGTVTARAPVMGVTTAAVQSVFERFTGPQAQVPPMFSAVKIGGKRLYELARAGEEVERSAREITIYSLELLSLSETEPGFPLVRFDVRCSKGTYIRTLCVDLGSALGGLAHLAYLLRTAAGPFDLAGSATIEEVTAAHEAGELASLLYPIDYPLADWPAYDLTPTAAAAVLHGNTIAAGFSSRGAGSGDRVRLYSPAGRFLALGTLNPDGSLSPRKVMAQGAADNGDN